MTRTAFIPEPRTPRPVTRAAKIALIRQTFAAPGNEWDASEQSRYLKSLGFAGAGAEQFTDEDLDGILNDLRARE